jgi:hypothetical protein
MRHLTDKEQNMADHQRLVRFELHIRPLMRIIDRDHMMSIGSRSINLFDYQQVRDHAQKILDRVQGNPPGTGDMPPSSSGGAWPAEWIALFERWMTEGFLKLELAEATYTTSRRGTTVTLIAEGEFPSAEDNGWFERLNENESPREYILYREPAINGAPPPQPFQIKEKFSPPGSPTSVIVFDANGRHEVPIT